MFQSITYYIFIAENYIFYVRYYVTYYRLGESNILTFDSFFVPSKLNIAFNSLEVGRNQGRHSARGFRHRGIQPCEVKKATIKIKLKAPLCHQPCDDDDGIDDDDGDDDDGEKK